MGLFNRKAKISREDWWKEERHKISRDHNIACIKSLSVEKQSEFDELSKLVNNEMCCLCEKRARRKKDDLKFTEALYKLQTSSNSTLWNEQQKINKKVAQTIVEAHVQSNNLERGIVALNYNAKRVSFFDKLLVGSSDNNVIAAVANRIGSDAFIVQIISGLTFYVCNSLGVEFTREEKRHIFEFFENQYFEIDENLAKFKFVES